METGSPLHSPKRRLEAHELVKRKEAKWLTILRKNFRDVVLLGFGAWIIYKQVYALNPNGYLALIGFGMMVPSARFAITKILSEQSSSSSSSDSPPELPPASSSGTSSDE